MRIHRTVWLQAASGPLHPWTVQSWFSSILKSKEEQHEFQWKYLFIICLSASCCRREVAGAGHKAFLGDWCIFLCICISGASLLSWIFFPVHFWRVFLHLICLCLLMSIFQKVGLGKQLLNLSCKVCAFITECCAAFHHTAAANLGDVMNLSLQPDFFCDLPWV